MEPGLSILKTKPSGFNDATANGMGVVSVEFWAPTAAVEAQETPNCPRGDLLPGATVQEQKYDAVLPMNAQAPS